MELTDRIALVTGASRGIGAATARALAARGADVIVHYHRERDGADGVARDVEAAGGRALVVQADVTNEPDVARMAAEVAGFCGERGLDILFANAGAYPSAPFAEITPAQWRDVIGVNVDGPFLCAQAFLPLLRTAAARTGRGRIITVGSVIPALGTANFVAYATAKAALQGFTHSLARELGDDGITVNCVVPSMVATDTALAQGADRAQMIVGLQMIKRLQTPEDLAGVVAFIVSDAADLMTGQTVVVDGGRVLT